MVFYKESSLEILFSLFLISLYILANKTLGLVRNRFILARTIGRTRSDVLFVLSGSIGDKNEPKSTVNSEISHYSSDNSAKIQKTVDINRVIELVNKAVELIKEKGKKTAFELINNSPTLKDGALYIFAIDMKGKVLAHGGDLNQIGKNQINLKDSYGVYFIKKFIEAMKSNDIAREEYAWKNYENFKIEKKLTYLRKIDSNTFIGCGIYLN